MFISDYASIPVGDVEIALDIFSTYDTAVVINIC